MLIRSYISFKRSRILTEIKRCDDPGINNERKVAVLPDMNMFLLIYVHNTDKHTRHCRRWLFSKIEGRSRFTWQTIYPSDNLPPIPSVELLCNFA